MKRLSPEGRTVAMLLGVVVTMGALAWAAVVTAWALRYGNWYGRPRADGKPG